MVENAYENQKLRQAKEHRMALYEPDGETKTGKVYLAHGQQPPNFVWLDGDMYVRVTGKGKALRKLADGESALAEGMGR